MRFCSAKLCVYDGETRRERQTLFGRVKIDWRESFDTAADAAHSELWSGIRCVDPQRDKIPQRAKALSKQNIFPLLCYMPDNINCFR